MTMLKKSIPRILLMAWFFSLAMTVCPYLCEAKAYQEQKTHSCCQKNQTGQKSKSCATHDQCGNVDSLKAKAACDNLPAPQLIASAFAEIVYLSKGIIVADIHATSPPKLPLYLIKVSLLF
jgi:hypothetical protein